LRRLQREGDAAQAQTHVLSTPDVILQQTFGVDSHNHDMPMGCDFGDGRPGDAGDDSDEEWEDEVRKQADELREALKLQSRARTGYQEHRTRRDRTDRTWAQFQNQYEQMTDAYLKWQLHKAEPPPTAPSAQVVSTLGIQIIDIFGKASDIQGFCFIC
jgi:hypothetical protein